MNSKVRSIKEGVQAITESWDDLSSEERQEFTHHPKIKTFTSAMVSLDYILNLQLRCQLMACTAAPDVLGIDFEAFEL